ncbi:hypothetical protein ACM66B_004347 [Microbotryomycetes sp. NB124-2]
MPWDEDTSDHAYQGKELYQLTQWTCTFDQRSGHVACKPFVRTFIEKVNMASQAPTKHAFAGQRAADLNEIEPGARLQEVTQHVNQGGRLPLGRMGVDEAMYGPLARLRHAGAG